MKKLLLFPLLLSAVFVVWNSSCQKDTQTDPAKVEQSIGATTDDRGFGPPTNPCGNRQTVIWYQLAASGNIATQNFQTGWKSGELDRIANDCVLGNVLPGD